MASPTRTDGSGSDPMGPPASTLRRMPAATPPAPATAEKYILETLDTLPEDNNYKFMKSIILVKDKTDMEDLKNKIIALNGYAAANIIMDDTKSLNILNLIIYEETENVGSDILPVQMLFFMFLNQMLFNATINKKKTVYNIQEKNFAEQYELVRTECKKGLGLTTHSYFGIPDTVWKLGLAKDEEKEEQVKSWWERNSFGAFLSVNNDVEFDHFVEIFSLGPKVMRKLFEIENEILKSKDYSDNKSLLGLLHNYRNADIHAPNKSPDLRETIERIKATKSAKPRFANAEQLLEYLKTPKEEISKTIIQSVQYPHGPKPGRHNEAHRDESAVAGTGLTAQPAHTSLRPPIAPAPGTLASAELTSGVIGWPSPVPWPPAAPPTAAASAPSPGAPAASPGAPAPSPDAPAPAPAAVGSAPATASQCDMDADCDMKGGAQCGGGTVKRRSRKNRKQQAPIISLNL